MSLDDKAAQAVSAMLLGRLSTVTTVYHGDAYRCTAVTHRHDGTTILTIEDDTHDGPVMRVTLAVEAVTL